MMPFADFPIRELKTRDFPAQLSEISDPPERLFMRGELPRERIALTVVGARRHTPYAARACRILLEGLSGHPIAIVSGLALGCDAIAHRAALAANLATVAVPGSGLSGNVLYPAAHRGLAREILERGGALLSEYEPDEEAAPWSFPRRNRIMAGLAEAVLVLEARERSGSLITARLALEYNRRVFAVPGPIDSTASEGPNRLIAEGAIPARSADDILAEFGMEQSAPPADETGRELSERERALLSLLDTPRAKDDVVAELGIEAHEAGAIITELVMKGVIVEEGASIRRRGP